MAIFVFMHRNIQENSSGKFRICGYRYDEVSYITIIFPYHFDGLSWRRRGANTCPSSAASHDRASRLFGTPNLHTVQ